MGGQSERSLAGQHSFLRNANLLYMTDSIPGRLVRWWGRSSVLQNAVLPKPIYRVGSVNRLLYWSKWFLKILTQSMNAFFKWNLAIASTILWIPPGPDYPLAFITRTNRIKARLCTVNSRMSNAWRIVIALRLGFERISRFEKSADTIFFVTKCRRKSFMIFSARGKWKWPYHKCGYLHEYKVWAFLSNNARMSICCSENLIEIRTCA